VTVGLSGDKNKLSHFDFSLIYKAVRSLENVYFFDMERHLPVGRQVSLRVKRKLRTRFFNLLKY